MLCREMLVGQGYVCFVHMEDFMFKLMRQYKCELTKMKGLLVD